MLRFVHLAMVFGLLYVSGSPRLEAADMTGSPAGVWKGTYSCHDVPIGLTLTITQQAEGSVNARFDFYPVESNDRRIVAGGFLMDGVFDKSTGRIDLKPGRWINRPRRSGYQTAGLEGVLTDGGSRLEGKILLSACSSVRLTRMSGSPSTGVEPVSKEEAVRRVQLPHADAPSSPFGVWQGQFICNREAFGMTLTVTEESGRTVSARFKYQPARAGSRRLPTGEMRLSGRFDEIAGQLKLEQVGSPDQPDGLGVGGLEGVLGADATTLAGKLVGSQRCGAFEATRVSLDPSTLPEAQTVEEFFADAPKTMSEATTSAERCAAWARWASRFRREYPDLDVNKSPNQAIQKILNLYRDDYFAPFYGKKLTEITAEEGVDLRKWIQSCPQNFPAELRKDLGQYFKGSLFWPPITAAITRAQGRSIPNDPLPQLAAFSALALWADRIVQGVKDLPDTEDSLERLAAYLAKGETELGAIWPSEQSAFLATIRGRRSAIATKLLDDVTADLDAVDASPEGLNVIAGYLARVERYKEALAPERRTDFIAALNNRRDAILGTLMQKDLDTLDREGKTLDDVIANTEWWRGFEARYAGYEATAPYRDVHRTFESVRLTMLGRAKPEFEFLLAAIDYGPDAEGTIDKILAVLFSLPRDDRSQLYKDYRGMASTRLAVLEEAHRRRLAAEEREQQQRRAAEIAAIKDAVYSGVHRCDELAAHPDDPIRTAPGIADDALDLQTGVDACIEAVDEHPQTPRFQFQLGRLLLKGGAYGEARQFLDAAANAEHVEHAGAMAYLGDVYQFGMGVPADFRRALVFYDRAAKGGFAPAATALAVLKEQHARDIFDVEGFEEPKIVRGIYEGDFDSIGYKQAYVNLYLITMMQTLEFNCQVEVSPTVKVKLQKQGFRNGMREIQKKGGFNMILEQFQDYQKQLLSDPSALVGTDLAEKQAARDASILVHRHGCDGSVTKTFVANAEHFAEQ